MATTTPDNLRSPNPGDPYNLVADWATSMSSVQTALDRRANLYKGTSAQRTAFTTAPEGVHWQDTNGSKTLFTRQGGRWVARSVSGVVSVASSSSAGGTANVTFPSGSFATPPLVMVSKQSDAAAKYIPYATNITASGFRVGIYTGDGTSGTNTASVGWIAFSV